MLFIKNSMPHCLILGCVLASFLLGCGNTEQETAEPDLSTTNSNSEPVEMTSFTKQYGIGDFNEVDAVSFLESGNIVIAGGWYNGDAIFDIETMNAYAMCIDGRGNMLWQKTWGGSNQDNIRFIIPTEDGGCFLIGRYDENRPGEQYAQVTTWILALNSEGDLDWEDRISRDGSLQPWSAIDIGDRILIAGSRSIDLFSSVGFLLVINHSGEIGVEKEFTSSSPRFNLDHAAITAEGDCIISGSIGEIGEYRGFIRLLDVEYNEIWAHEFAELRSVQSVIPMDNGSLACLGTNQTSREIGLYELDDQGRLGACIYTFIGAKQVTNPVRIADSFVFGTLAQNTSTSSYEYRLFKVSEGPEIEDLGVVETVFPVGYSSSCALAVNQDLNWMAVASSGFTESGQNSVALLTTLPVQGDNGGSD